MLVKSQAGRPRLQRIGLRGTLSNLHPFGGEIRRHLLAQYEWFVPLHGFGMSDGGCRILAEALVSWSDGYLRMRAAVSDIRDGRVQHWVASDGCVNLDANGLGTDLDTTIALDRLECTPRCRIVELEQAPRSSVIMSCRETSLRLSSTMRDRFGKWKPSMISSTAIRQAARL